MKVSIKHEQPYTKIHNAKMADIAYKRKEEKKKNSIRKRDHWNREMSDKTKQ